MSGRSLFVIISGIVTIIIYLLLIIATPIAVRRLPVDFFTNPKYIDHQRDINKTGPLRYYATIVCRSLLGISIIILGTVGLQGVLCVILGLGIMDFPGKSKAIRKLVNIGFVWRLFEKIRSRANLPALERP